MIYLPFILPILILILTFIGHLYIQRYIIKKNSYEKFYLSFVAIATAGRILFDKNDVAGDILKNEYMLQEKIIRLYATKKLIKFLNNIRWESKIEEDRPIFLEILSKSCKEKTAWQDLDEDCLSNYFSYSNYQKLFSIIKKDTNSLNFVLGIK